MPARGMGSAEMTPLRPLAMHVNSRIFQRRTLGCNTLTA